MVAEISALPGVEVDLPHLNVPMFGRDNCGFGNRRMCPAIRLQFQTLQHLHRRTFYIAGTGQHTASPP